MHFQAAAKTKIAHLPEQRYALKKYIESTFIPGILEHDGSDFLASLTWGGPRFVCDLYNGVWEKYLQERPFDLSDFRMFEAFKDAHEIVFFSVPALPGTEGLFTSGLAFANNLTETYDDIRLYRVQKNRIDNDTVVFEVFGPGGRVGCTPSAPEADMGATPTEIIRLIWQMAFEEDSLFAIEEIEDCDELNRLMPYNDNGV